MTTINKHTFHIPVMGIGFTLDTPIKVAQYGIDSVMAIGNDSLIEKLRKKYCEYFNIPYEEIDDKIEDFKAKRITAYLNLVHQLAKNKFETLKNNLVKDYQEYESYFNTSIENASNPSNDTGKHENNNLNIDNLTLGSIDVNIMTKLDNANYKNNEKLPQEQSDAHIALRGYANSDLNSSIIFSAGMNPKLFSYLEEFEDFYPNKAGFIKKKIVLKVSDYRSASIQGKFLAKKGLWVSEYRIESGLNCGGHAFATDGHLLGPILAEFRDKRIELIDTVYTIYTDALTSKNSVLPDNKLTIKISAQGGVGTSNEHQFLLDYYAVDSVGWGSPFLLVPEATNVDKATLEKLAAAKESDIYLSNISPLGVPFHNLKGTTKEIEKYERVYRGIPGSPCVHKYLSFNTEFTDRPICTASRQYQKLKIKELQQENVSSEEYKKIYDKIVEKECICTGLNATVLLNNNISSKPGSDAVSICPGPNLVYFDKVMNLKEIIDHIYGRANVLPNSYRPNMFVKELQIYLDYLKSKIEESKASMTDKVKNYLVTFSENLNSGIKYYNQIFSESKSKWIEKKSRLLEDLIEGQKKLNLLSLEIENLSLINN